MFRGHAGRRRGALHPAFDRRAFAQPPDAGRRQYGLACSRCHGGDGNGGELGPGIVTRLFARDDEGLPTLVRDGLPAAGMPGFFGR